ncbi:hypothetical protein [Haloferula sp. BvORR071]|uniref:hypothetical protein n=1 Tax=Haloferula sp. BvORR071 TaxID=1396141 RepID=UPI000550CDBC|nr:hypothetical protein [Haloferula sp. BvORR071]
MIVFVYILPYLILVPLLIGTTCSQNKRARIGFGCALGLACALIFEAAKMLERFNYNIWYSSATHSLIGATVEGLEGGRQQEVLAELKKVHAEMNVTYEKRGNYLQLAKDASERLKAAATK